MPKPSISSAQNKALQTGFLDLVGEPQGNYEVVNFNTLASSMAYVGAVYIAKLKAQLIAKDADSSGELSDGTIAHDVEILGNLYRVEIETKKYASFLDEGVNGWAVDRGSRFQFKTKGVDPNGEMVQAVRNWLVREGNIGRIKNRPVSERERKRSTIIDTTTRAAISTTYMIKRSGIKPTWYWRDATNEMGDVIKKEFGAALRVDIVQNITGKR